MNAINKQKFIALGLYEHYEVVQKMVTRLSYIHPCCHVARTTISKIESQ
jgi:hypothetical protein